MLLQMKKILLLTLFILLCSNESFAKKIYKIVDADGNVTFSEIEPTVQADDPVQVESLKMSNANNAMTSIRIEDGRETCGDIQLPYNRTNSYGSKKRDSSKYFLRNVQNSKNNWQSSLSRLTDQMARSSKQYLESRKRRQSSYYAKQQSSQYQKRSEVNNARIRDLRCAINWAESKNESMSDSLESTQAEKKRLIAISYKIEENIISKCGPEPVYDPSNGMSKERSRNWTSCSYSQRRDLKDVKRKISRLQ